MAKGKMAGAASEKALLSLPTQMSNSLPPLRASTPAASPAPNKREPSLMILSRQIVDAVRRPTRGAHLQPPAPPPRSNLERKRRSADPTDYNVQVLSAYETPPLPAQPGLVGAHATSLDTSWESDVELLTNRKVRAHTLRVAVAVAGAAAIALAIYWR